MGLEFGFEMLGFGVLAVLEVLGLGAGVGWKGRKSSLPGLVRPLVAVLLL